MRKSFDYARLSPEAQTSYDVWIYQLEQAEAALPFRTNAYIFDQMSAIHSFLPQLLIAFHRVEDASDMEGYINRIRESGRALRQLIEISKQNATDGVRPPRFAYDFVIDESTKIITGVPFTETAHDSAVWADVKAKIAALQKKGATDRRSCQGDAGRGAGGAHRSVQDRLRLADRVAAGGPRHGAGEARPACTRCRMARPSTRSGLPTRPRRR